MSEAKPILIVGAGVGGLALAQSFRKRSIPYRVFERDESIRFRLQGYRFQINPLGQRAIESIATSDLQAQIRASAPIADPATEGSFNFFKARSGQQIPMVRKMGGAGSTEGALPLDRGTLRGLLAQGADVEFGKSFQSYDIQPDGVRVDFKDGSHAEGSLLIGADGVHSHVRKQLIPGYELLDTEGRWIWGKTDITPEYLEKANPELWSGMKSIRDDINPELPYSLFVEYIRFNRDKDHPLPEFVPKHDYVYWVLQTNKKHYEGIDDERLLKLKQDEVVQLSHKLTTEWDPGFQRIIEFQNPGAAALQKVVSAVPKIVEWDGQGRVTLIGDACHAMPPTSASGATTAMRDAALLSDNLASLGPTKEALSSYETHMREYAEAAILSSDPRSKTLFGAPPLVEMKRIPG